ncbi:MAG: class I SAM-dependent methyltransferase [Ilumatobacter sp.]|nr:class I SAM-dependent methyltransferase [Ilumatobacter sp.]
MAGLSRHVAENRRHWDATADRWVVAGERAWSRAEPTWGIWGVADADLSLLPADMSGLDAIELGCGTGYVSAWMHRRGAAVCAVDISAEQLATATRLAGVHEITDIDWVQCNAEAVPRPDATFDFAISEYGAAIWCDPTTWIPEAHRLLRPGGRLVFLGHHPLAMVCMSPAGDEPAGMTLQRPYFGLGQLDWTEAIEDPGGIEFNRTVSGWIELFDRTGFDIERYAEVQAPDEAEGQEFWMPAEWSQQYPSEQVWFLRKR